MTDMLRYTSELHAMGKEYLYQEDNEFVYIILHDSKSKFHKTTGKFVCSLPV